MELTEEIKAHIAKEVKRQLDLEKTKLANKVRAKLEYTGEFAKAYRIMEVFREW